MKFTSSIPMKRPVLIALLGTALFVAPSFGAVYLKPAKQAMSSLPEGAIQLCLRACCAEWKEICLKKEGGKCVKTKKVCIRNNPPPCAKRY